MARPRPAMTLALAVLLIVAACSTPAGTIGPGLTATAGAAATSGTTPTNGAAAGEPCSFLSAEAVGAAMGTTPVEVAERAGRGDCD